MTTLFIDTQSLNQICSLFMCAQNDKHGKATMDGVIFTPCDGDTRHTLQELTDMLHFMRVLRRVTTVGANRGTLELESGAKLEVRTMREELVRGYYWPFIGVVGLHTMAEGAREQLLLRVQENGHPNAYFVVQQPAEV